MHERRELIEFISATFKPAVTVSTTALLIPRAQLSTIPVSLQPVSVRGRAAVLEPLPLFRLHLYHGLEPA